MDWSSGSARLHHVLKNLRVQWDETKWHWTDPVRDAFENEHIIPLEAGISAVLTEISSLEQVLRQAVQECSDNRI